MGRSPYSICGVIKPCFCRRLKTRWRDYCAGEISFAEFDTSVQGWINHVRYADTWGLRTRVLGQPLQIKSCAEGRCAPLCR